MSSSRALCANLIDLWIACPCRNVADLKWPIMNRAAARIFLTFTLLGGTHRVLGCTNTGSKIDSKVSIPPHDDFQTR